VTPVTSTDGVTHAALSGAVRVSRPD